MIKDANITIHVKDLEASISFYLSLGLFLKNRWGNYYAQVTGPGITIGLHPAGERNVKPDSGNVSIGFVAENFDEAKNLLQAKSVTFSERSEEGGDFIHFSDPDGTALYFYKSRW